MNHYENSAPNTSDNKAKAEEIFKKKTGFSPSDGAFVGAGLYTGFIFIVSVF